MQTHRPLPRLAFGRAGVGSSRELPAEVAVALSYNGSTQAVMMATPADLVDFAYGFSLTEGIINSASEIRSITTEPVDDGVAITIDLVPDRFREHLARRRNLSGRTSCGLCGIDSLAEAVRVAQQYLSYFQGPVADWQCADQRLLRHAVPEKRTRVYDVRALIRTLCDDDSVLELRPRFAPREARGHAHIAFGPNAIAARICGVAQNPERLGVDCLFLERIKRQLRHRGRWIFRACKE